jgi:hypothetical protein
MDYHLFVRPMMARGRCHPAGRRESGFRVTVIINSLAFLVGHPQNGDARNSWNSMQRYRIITPLVAVRLCRSNETDKAGVIASLSADAVVEIHGPSALGDGMIEVAWEHQRYAVFERDLATRAILVRTAAVGD